MSAYSRVNAEHINVGDVLRLMGEDHRITAVEPYVGTLFKPDEARTARSGADWAITLINGQPFDCLNPHGGAE